MVTLRVRMTDAIRDVNKTLHCRIARPDPGELYDQSRGHQIDGLIYRKGLDSRVHLIAYL